jgi:diguanylate cyclase (GGDEF)-like protein
MNMPMAAFQTREKIPTGANSNLPDGLASAAGPVLCRGMDDALGTARQLFESWLRSCVGASFGQAAAPGRDLPRAVILKIVDKARAPQASNAESRRLVHQLAEKLKELEVLLQRVPGPAGSRARLGGEVLEAGLEILSIFASLEVERAALLAAADPLTGLGGRRALEERLKQERSRTGREGRRCAVALLDVDHFKRVNDAHGHSTGDRVLVGLAGVLQQSLRSYDGVYRYGGEEFVLCLPGVEATAAHRMVERIRKAVTLTPFETPTGHPFFVSFSAGIADLAPSLAPAQSLELADGALYRAKSAGRNRVFLAQASAAE